MLHTFLQAIIAQGNDQFRRAKKQNKGQKLKGKIKKSSIVGVRLNEAHKAILQEYADKSGIGLTTFIRQSALQAGEISPFLDQEDVALIEVLQEDLRKIGVNLNQITRSINAGRFVSADEILQNLSAVREIVEFTQVTFAECLNDAAKRQRKVVADV